jgi:flagellar basal-body rod modification protein FlgD
MGAVSTGSNSVTQPLSSLLGTKGSSTGATGTSGSSSTGQNIAGAQQSLAGDQQTFLKLLTTQLQNQDPLNPMNTDQFTQQLVAMTGVQQQILTNELLQQLVGNQTGVGNPVDLLGKAVTATSNAATLQGGKADWIYTTAAQSADVQMTVTNDLGQTVAQQDLGAVAPGQYTYTWNGKDQTGVQLPDGGTYTLAIKAVDASGNTVSTATYQQGTVSAVNNSGGQVLLTVNGAPVPASSVVSVTQTQ